MRKIAWLLVLALPPWALTEFNAPKWVVMLSAAPFFLFAMRLGDPDEHLLGEASGTFRKGALIVMGIGGLVLGFAFYILWLVLFPRT